MATEIKRRLIGRRNMIHIRLNSCKLREMYMGQRSDNCSYVPACLTEHLSYALESRRSINLPPTNPLPVRHCIVSQFKTKLFLSASDVRLSVHISVCPSLCLFSLMFSCTLVDSVIQCDVSYNILPRRCRYKQRSPYCMVMSHCAQTGRPQPASLIIIDRWQLPC